MARLFKPAPLTEAFPAELLAVEEVRLPIIHDNKKARASLRRPYLVDVAKDRENLLLPDNGEERFQELEFYGDAVLKHLVSRVLSLNNLQGIERTPHFLNICESHLISNSTLCRLSLLLGLHQVAVPPFAWTDQSYENISDQHVKELADMLEAHLGALDQEDRFSELLLWANATFSPLFNRIRSEARTFVEHTWSMVFQKSPSPCDIELDCEGIVDKDPKATLHEIGQRLDFRVEYRVVRQCILIPGSTLQCNEADVERLASFALYGNGERKKETDAKLAAEARRCVETWWPEKRDLALTVRSDSQKRRKLSKHS